VILVSIKVFALKLSIIFRHLEEALVEIHSIGTEKVRIKCLSLANWRNLTDILVLNKMRRLLLSPDIFESNILFIFVFLDYSNIDWSPGFGSEIRESFIIYIRVLEQAERLNFLLRLLFFLFRK